MSNTNIRKALVPDIPAMALVTIVAKNMDIYDNAILLALTYAR